jgi:hypothetical protein
MLDDILNEKVPMKRR